MERTGISDRFKRAIRALGYRSLAQFARETTLPRSTVYSLASEGRQPYSQTLDELEKLGINPDWLLTGAGEMLVKNDEPPQGVRDARASYGSSNPEQLMRQIKDLATRQDSGWELFSLVMQTIEMMEPDKQEMVFLSLKKKFDDKPGPAERERERD